MTTPSALVAGLVGRGVRLTADGGRLVVNAPRGVVTAEERETLVRYKPAVLALLSPPAPAAADWLAARWGPGLDDDTPGIVIPPDRRSRVDPAVFARALDPTVDPYAAAEREAIRLEGGDCGGCFRLDCLECNPTD